MRLRSLLPSDAIVLAGLHGLAFPAAETWSAASFAELLDSAGVSGWGGLNDSGELVACLVARTVAGESEILTLAVAPNARREGRARRLVLMFLGESARLQAPDIFLEVAEDNTAARTLYETIGFHEVGRRPRYYPGDRTALLLRWCGQTKP